MNEKIMVAGAGKSGIAASKLILETGGEVLLYDGNEALSEERLLAEFPEDARITLCLGELDETLLQGVQICVMSPGIDLETPFVKTLTDRKIQLWSEIELGFQVAKGQLVAITGTNGKTTTTALTGAIMERVPLKNGTFDFLSGITSSSHWPEVRARAFAEVLEWLKHRYDLVICDVAAPIEVDEELTFDGPAPRRNAATLTALACADRVIALGEADVIGLPRLINLAREVQSRPDLFAPETDVQYWLNRSRREAAGFNPEAKMRDNWARYLSVPLTGVIPYERKVMDRLRRNGEALLEVAPRHAVVQSLEAMLEGMYAVRPGA